ncbi:hypothetical protein D9611_001392 [Ephemerocybe angulata]|uniref:Telomeric single stranded DNA binding POT1/Cdc13 domain-containing protein n=1 Tax=Ephemerocybe angulata TaxID=980116 RepID=A0A8H5CHL6_9AGAR|nr:hypothetical protein D9611_001392 [Tulosesus angulatus]
MKRPSIGGDESDSKRIKSDEADCPRNPSDTEKIDQAEGTASSTHTQEPKSDLPKLPEGFVSIDALSRGEGIVSVIGIVQESEPILRAARGTRDWKQSLRIGDASTRPGERVRVNLFAKDESHLPNPNIGDILILRGVRDTGYQAASQLVGSSGGYTWHIVCKKPGSSDRKAPWTTPLEPAVVEFCQRLLDWDSEKNETEAVSELLGLEVDKPVLVGRSHTLLDGLQAALDGNGYIDTTVEVLAIHPYETEPNRYTVWATDYTRNPEWESHNSGFNFFDWCPVPFRPYAFRIEFWDDAAVVAPTMKKNGYYNLRNTCVRRDNFGLIEGRQREAKITLLNEDDEYPHLKALVQHTVNASLRQ